jgi:ankyrin repeat protein
METIQEVKSNHSADSASVDISVDPESTTGEDSSDFDDLLSEASASSSVFEASPNVAITSDTTNLLAPLENDSDDDGDDDEEGGGIFVGMEVSDDVTQETEPMDISNEDEDREIEHQLVSISSSESESFKEGDHNDDNGNDNDDDHRQNSESESESDDDDEQKDAKVYDLGGGGSYDLGAPISAYDLGAKTYDLGAYLSEAKKKDDTSAPKKTTDPPSSVHNHSQSTQHRSGSSAYIFHKWMTDRDWTAARAFLTAPDLKQKHLQASIFYKNEDGETSLHIACRKRAPFDIVKSITDVGGLESVIAVDTYGGSLPLHHACHFHASDDVIKLLVYIGGVESVRLRDAIGNLPLHWALSKEASFATVKLLIDIGGDDTINTTNKLGWNSLHAANYFSSNIKIIKLLIDIGNLSVVRSVNRKGQTPLDILYEKNPFDTESIQLVQDVMGEDKDLLSWIPPQTVDKSMTWIGRQSESVQERGFSFPFIQMILNEAFVARKFLFIMILDLFAQLMLVVTLSYFVDMDTWFGYKDPNLEVLCVLGYSIVWLGIRCITQMIATPIRSWIAELSNWTYVAQTVLVLWSYLILNEDGISREYQSIIAIATIGIVWLRLVYVFGELFHSIAVFAVALQRIASKLFAFTITSILVLVGFAHMLYTASKFDAESCKIDCVQHSLRESYQETFSSFFNPSNLIEEAVNFSSSSYRSVLIIIFAIIIELILLNVLIAEIVTSLFQAKKGGNRAFWRKRYEIICHNKVFYTVLEYLYRYRRQQSASANSSDSKDRKEEGDRKSKIPTTRYTFSTAIHEAFPGDFYNFRRWWVKDGAAPSLVIRLKYFLSWASVEEIFMPCPTFERVISGGKRDMSSHLARAFLYLIFPIFVIIQCVCFIAGLVTLGYLWPKWMKRKLFSGPIGNSSSISIDSNTGNGGTRDDPAVGIAKYLDVLKHEIKSVHNVVRAEKFTVTKIEEDMKAIQLELKMMHSTYKRSTASSVFSDELEDDSL